MTSSPPRPRQWALLSVVVSLLAAAVCVAFIREPGFGDDFTYWSFAFDLHERGLAAWQRHSFHDLRWPVWGVCWLLQALLGIGILSYYGEPVVYLVAGALLALSFGRKLFGTAAAACACSIAFLFHPLLDTVCYRPMPDLSEGVLGAAVMLAWWALMKSETRSRRILFAVLVGLLVFVLESNRLTGVFIVPVLVVGTLLFFRARFGWLLAAGLIAALSYGAEMWFYHGLFGDWFHNLHANLGGKGNKGTEPIPLWYLPFRFLDTLWKGNPLAPFYCVLAAVGIPALWMRGATLGRMVVLWFAILFVEYSCAPQSIWPWRPLIRDADRFLCGLAVPFSILGVAGLWQLGRWAAVLSDRKRSFASISPRQRTGGALALIIAAIVALWAGTTRDRFTLGFVPEARAYMQALPPNTRIFSHDPMRAMAFLCDASSAGRLTWFAPRTNILHREPTLEAEAARSDEFWYARKLVWLNTRKKLEKKELPEQPPLASYFDAPERDWMMTRLLAKADNPDLVFYRRRTPESPPAKVLTSAAAELGGIVPPLPATWTRSAPSVLAAKWQVPAALRGKLMRLEIEAGSAQVEAFVIRLKFKSSRGPAAEYLLKPYLHPEGGKEFFALPLPADAEMCEVQLKFARNARAVEFTGFRAIVD